MSLDKSLKGKNTLERHRNVLTRAERVETLQELALWTDDSTAIGMPKVAHRKVKAGKKVKEEKTESTEGTETTDQPDETKA